MILGVQSIISPGCSTPYKLLLQEKWRIVRYHTGDLGALVVFLVALGNKKEEEKSKDIQNHGVSRVPH